MDHILALRAFLRISETGAFGRAADQLNLPRSTVSKLIQDLENHLGVRLVQRTTRSVSVTAEGAAYYERAVRLLAELEHMDATASQTRAQPKGILRLEIGSSLANLILIPALRDFREKYPDIVLHLGVGDRPVDLVNEGVDCAIRGGVLANSSLIAKRLCQFEYVTCASHSFIEAHGSPVHPRDLETTYPVVSYTSSLSGRPFPLHFRRGDERIEISASSGIAVNESTAHMTSLSAGLGIGQTFRFMAQRYFDDGSLVSVLDDWKRPPHPMHVLYPPNRHLSAKLRVFVDWVTGVFASGGVQ
jgi:LysR family transcriptional regulator, regulator for bpeEF and oprC